MFWHKKETICQNSTTLTACSQGKYISHWTICPVVAFIFFTYLPESQIKKKNSIYSDKFFHNFHLSESSFTCPWLRESGLARRLYAYPANNKCQLTMQAKAHSKTSQNISIKATKISIKHLMKATER